MLGKKIMLTPQFREYIINHRKAAMEHNPKLTADYISVKIGRAKSWLSQVENGRLKSVKTDDLINVFCVIENCDIHFQEYRDNIAYKLDNEIMLEQVLQERGLTDENGNDYDFVESIFFQQIRGHLQYAERNIRHFFWKFYNSDISELKRTLKDNTRSIFSLVVDWINRAFDDTADLFSDEISMRNLYLILETSMEIHENHCDYYGLNHLNFPKEKVAELKEKMDIDYFLRPKSVIKPLEEYTSIEIQEVVKHFSPEDFMLWKNKHTYAGSEPCPMTISRIKDYKDKDNYITYDDVSDLHGLSEEEYLYIIKQIYYHFDYFYKSYKDTLKEYEEMSEDYDECYEERNQLQEELDSLKNNSDTTSNSSSNFS